MKDINRNFITGMIAGIMLVICVNTLVMFALPKFSTVARFDNDEKIDEIIRLIDSHYVDEYSQEDLADGMFLGMVYGLGDRYSAYLSEDTFTAYLEDTEGVYTGIGVEVTLTEDGRVMVVSPYDGSPAATAGLQPKDIITMVNGVDISTAGLENVVSLIKGDPGTTVNVTVFRESESKTFDVDMTRENITRQTIAYELMNNSIGYIRISGFDGVTVDQFNLALNELKGAGAKGYILDLRNNPGGRLDVVSKIVDKLVPEGTIVYTEDKNGEQNFVKSDAEYLNMPITVLVNGNSASASEVMAGAIKDYEVGTLVGEQTFGKGIVQMIYPLKDGSAVKLTMAKYYTPKGICVQGEGITPDYVVPMDSELSAAIADLAYEDDVQLQKAVEVIEGMIVG